jgi:uncharacterized protein (TIGR02722 family)
MTRIFLFVICIVLGVFAAACSSNPQVTRVDADTRTDLSGYWNDTDVRIVCESLISSALSSPRIDAYIKNYAANNKGEVPAVIVGRFRNTSSEHIDTSIISGIMRTAILNSGKLEFVEGGDAREDIRAERQDQQWNASEQTAAALAQETGANFMLTGEVKSIIDSAGNTTVRTYFVKATMTNIETNRILWEGEYNDIKKTIQQSRAKL